MWSKIGKITMKITSVNPYISFKNNLRIKLTDKTVGASNGCSTPMLEIFKISNENKVPLFISRDVFILGSSDKIKKSLEQKDIKFEEIKDIL